MERREYEDVMIKKRASNKKMKRSTAKTVSTQIPDRIENKIIRGTQNKPCEDFFLNLGK